MSERDPLAGGNRRPRTSNYEKLKVIAATFVALWMLASIWQHTFASLRMLRDPRPTSMTHRVGFITTTMRYDTAVGTGTTGAATAGTTAPIGTPGTTATNVDPSHLGTSRQALHGDEHESGFAIDIGVVCAEGRECVCMLNKVIPIPMWICALIGILVICWLIALIVDVILSWVCANKWVQEPVSWTECRERSCRWWDAWCWANKLFCYIVEGLKWVLKLICAWKEIIVWGTALVCAIVGIIILIMVL